MAKQLIKLSFFELKKNLIYSKTWLINAMFLLVNMSIFPFTMNLNSSDLLNQFFAPIIMTSMLLGIVLITNNVFDEDANDGSLDQYAVFGAKFHTVFLSKVITTSVEFALIISILLPLSALLYSVPFDIIWKIWLAIILSTPLLSSISVFGAVLTVNLRKNSAISIVIIFPLLISAFIILSLATVQIIETTKLTGALPYLEISSGISLLTIPVLCWLTKYLR